MNENFFVFGNESSVLCYNLNKQFSNVAKVVVTKDVVFDSLADGKIRDFFERARSSSESDFFSMISEFSDYEFSKEVFSDKLYKVVQEALPKISQSMMDVKIRDYSFMSSVSNVRFNVVLRCGSFSFSKYYIERGAIVSAFRSLLLKYLRYSGNFLRKESLDDFQFEIFESEEMYKHVFLKKEGGSIVLYDSFGFLFNDPIDFKAGGEIYFSRGDDFNFYPNRQHVVLIREQSKIVERDMKEQEKVLSNEELVAINEVSRGVEDVVLEMYFNSKGRLKIVDVSLPESSIFGGTETGLVLFKSSRNYSSISLLALRDNLDEESMNPKYVLVSSEAEIRELLKDVGVLRKADGLILTNNFYSPFLEKVCSVFDVDMIFINKPLKRSLDAKIDWDKIDVILPGESKPLSSNPFASIISSREVERDEVLERLKSVDLSTPVQGRSEVVNERIGNIAQGIISSPNASTYNRSSSGGVGFGGFSSGRPGAKKSAISFLAESALGRENKSSENVVEERVESREGRVAGSENSGLSGFGNFFSDAVGQAVGSSGAVEEVDEEVDEGEEEESEFDLNRYGEILATRIITPPHVESGVYFTDEGSLSSISEGEVYVVSESEKDYDEGVSCVVPVGLAGDEIGDGTALLINSPSDFFLVGDVDEGREYFVNLSVIDPVLKEGFLRECVNKFGRVNIIVLLEDLDLVEDYIESISGVFVKDLRSLEEYDEVNRKILLFEKRRLMKKFREEGES